MRRGSCAYFGGGARSWSATGLLAGKAASPDSVISRCEVDKHGASLLLSLKRVLDILHEQNSLVHGLYLVSKSSLLPRELWIDNCFHTGIDKPLEDLVGDPKQRYWAIALTVLLSLLRLWDRDYQCSSPDFGNFESAQAEKKEATSPGL